METKNRRISVHLTDYFKDHRRFSRVFVDDKILTINDLENHITKVFNIPKCFYLLCNNHYLPPIEDIRVLNSDDIVHVVRSSKPIEDSINKSDNLIEIDNLLCENNKKISKKKSKKVDLNIALINTSFIDEDCVNENKKRMRIEDDIDEYACKKSKLSKKTNLEISESENTGNNNCVEVKKKHKKHKEGTGNNKRKKDNETNFISEINENGTLITKQSKKNKLDESECTIEEIENEKIKIKKFKKNKIVNTNNLDESKSTKDETENENKVIKIRKKSKKNKNNLNENECTKETENEIKINKKFKKQGNDDMKNLTESECRKVETENEDYENKIRKKSKKMRNEESDTNQTNNSECAVQNEEIKITKLKQNKINELEERNSLKPILEKDTLTNNLANPVDQTSFDNNTTITSKSNNKIIVLNNENVHKDMNAIRNILEKSHERYSLNQTLNFANKRLNSSCINSSSDNINGPDDMFQFVTKRRRVRTRKRKCNNNSDDSFTVETPQYRPPNTAVTPLMHIKFNYNHSNSSNSSDVEESKKNENIDQVAMTNLFHENKPPEGDENLKDLLLQKVKEKYVELFEKTDLSSVEILKEVPPEKSIITFKILKMAEDYTPVISEQILAKVLGYDGNMVYLDILVGNNEFSDPKGKFSCDTDEGQEEVAEEPLFTNIFYEWSRMYEPKLITDK